MKRREFLQMLAAGPLLLTGVEGSRKSLVPASTSASTRSFQGTTGNNLIKGCLLHISYNMWEDRIAPERPRRGYRPFLRLEQSLWDRVIKEMAESGLNLAVLDVGDGVRYKSHPEISVKNAWSRQKLRRELRKLRDLGIEPIPKMNFSTSHDAWLGPYARMVSTEQYYTVCEDLISEVTELFDGPRFFHLGMDEETARHQRYYNYVSLRQGDLWWHDFLYLVNAVEQAGSKAWIWSDYIWDHQEKFLENMPKSVLQSNWYYGLGFDSDSEMVEAYRVLEEHGYDQVPTGSNHSNDENMMETVTHCRRVISQPRLKGFLQTIWRPPTNEYLDEYLAGITLAGQALQDI